MQLFGTVPRVSLHKLQGDASSRSYYRVTATPSDAEPSTMIAMHLPADVFKSDEGGAPPKSQELPFIAIAKLLEARGVPIPKILAEDLDNRVLLLEDLGDETLEARLRNTPRANWLVVYRAAIDLLTSLHDAFIDIPPSSLIAERSFDRTLLRWELDHFRQWGLEAAFGPLDPADRRTLDTAFADLTERIASLPTGFVHRDYQSRNLMWRSSNDLAVIDFQDAMTGPRVYDLVALLCDSYVDIAPALQNELLERYADNRQLDSDMLRQEFWLVALHRKLKDAGRFVYIDRVRGNPGFLQWFPQSLVYVGRALAELPEYRALAELLHRLIVGFPVSVEAPRPKGH